MLRRPGKLATGTERIGRLLKEQPENVFIIALVALTDMGLGDKAAAFALLERAMAAMPMERAC